MDRRNFLDNPIGVKIVVLFVSTLVYLIGEQEVIREQGGIFPQKSLASRMY